jgi:lysozyme family protein
MTAPNRDKCIAITLDYEGGNDDDPHDPGGRTSRGILQREWTPYVATHPGRNLPSDVWKAPQAAIVDIYVSKYWVPVSGDVWPAGMDLVVYDAGVNSGLGKARSWSAAVLGQDGALAQLAAIGSHVTDRSGFIQRFQAKRMSFLHALRTWAYFGKGWAHRVAGIEALALKMVGTAAGKSPAAVQADLKTLGATASQKSLAAGGASTASTAGGSATVATFDWSNWADIALGVCLLAISVALVAYLVHTWHTQRERAVALQRVAG